MLDPKRNSTAEEAEWQQSIDRRMVELEGIVKGLEGSVSSRLYQADQALNTMLECMTYLITSIDHLKAVIQQALDIQEKERQREVRAGRIRIRPVGRIVADDCRRCSGPADGDSGGT